MKPVKFVIPDKPMGKKAPRWDPVNKRMYTEKNAKARETQIENLAKEAAARAGIETPYEGPVKIEIDVYHAIPKNTPKYRVKLARTKELRPLTKPDLDNVTKMITDGCKGVVFQDDNQVVALVLNKFYSSEPRQEVRIEKHGCL